MDGASGDSDHGRAGTDAVGRTEAQRMRGIFLAFWRRLSCWGNCPCRHYEDANGCGGQCIRCGKIVGYVTNADLRAYADREIARRLG